MGRKTNRPPIPQPMVEQFRNVLEGDISLAAFEQWVYTTNEVAEVFERDDYLLLLSLDYSSGRVLHTIEHLLTAYASPGQIQTAQVRNRLDAIIEHTDKASGALLWLYDMSHHGYAFLGGLAVEYGQDLESLLEDGGSEDQEKALLASMYPDIAERAKQVRQWLNDEQVIITGDDGWIDRRTQGE